MHPGLRVSTGSRGPGQAETSQSPASSTDRSNSTPSELLTATQLFDLLLHKCGVCRSCQICLVTVVARFTAPEGKSCTSCLCCAVCCQDPVQEHDLQLTALPEFYGFWASYPKKDI